jgi:hypothetical protein
MLVVTPQNVYTADTTEYAKEKDILNDGVGLHPPVGVQELFDAIEKSITTVIMTGKE